MELVAERLACRRAGRLVFAHVAFTLTAGEAALLRGPNGSGKSTLLRLLAGLLPLEAGDATLGDVSLRQDRDSFQELVAYAGHLDAIKPQLTVRENLHLWARLYGAPIALPPGDPADEPDDEAFEKPRTSSLLDEAEDDADGATSAPAAPADRLDVALDRLGLLPIASFPAGYCSAGQKRRLGLARLLVIERPLWLLDEPTVSLDTDAAAIFAGMVRDHVAAGGMAIAATHVPLGLDHAQEIVMGTTAPAAPGLLGEDEAAPAPADDPFLEGDWR
jgi:heme exporter protein A